ncbi:hypothetical protein CDD82_1413 [Ophiocordyceps australis]|uniref:Tetratricopeptide repeat domain-containing protein n=1 Tax=Ophiocordyceps australis TaxID=1399860 RepID=A0A2C5ZNL1_9HYPO|nr:hypothetical protein CDD82_1413 [Ophiocordyceps australis]
MPTIYSSLYTNFIRQGSTFAKSISTHGYAQSVVAATHPHVLNSQNRPLFGRRHTSRLGRLSALHLNSAFHTDRTGTGLSSDQRHGYLHGGLDAYFEALQKKEATGELDKEWTQFEFPKRLEWKPNSSTVLATSEAITSGEDVASAQYEESPALTTEEVAALAHIDAALEKEIEYRKSHEVTENVPAGPSVISASRLTPLTPSSARSQRAVTPPVDSQSQSYADHLSMLSAASRYAEIPAVFEAMLATGVKPIATSYNALLVAAIHLPTKKIEVVSKALDVYADMVRRRVAPNSTTFNILVELLASRSLEVSEMKNSLETKRVRFGGMDEPGRFMFASHELEHAILCEDDRLDLAIKLFDTATDADAACYSAQTYHQLISACAKAGRVSDMMRLYEHMESHMTAPFAATFPTMIAAFAKRGDLVSAIECYNEYRNLAVANDDGKATLQDRLDSQVYASVVNAYVVSDKAEGAMKFLTKVAAEYGAKFAKMEDDIIGGGFVKGFAARGIYREALEWAKSVSPEARCQASARIAMLAADNDDKVAAYEAFEALEANIEMQAAPSIALLAMSIREGDVAAATKHWHALMDPQVRADASLIEPTAMYAVALIGSGQVAQGLAQSKMMFERIRACEATARPQLAEEIDEGVDFIHGFMESRGLGDAREMMSQLSSMPHQTLTASPYLSASTACSYEDAFDPYAHNTDFKGSSLIADDLERKGCRLSEALKRFRNIRRSGRHPRYITYSKLISAAARENKMELCDEVLAMARNDVPLLPQYGVVRYGWSSILDAMVGACLNMGNRGGAEKYHQELLDMGAAPSANTFGLYITTLKDSAKMFDEASEAVRIFHRAKTEGVEPSSFLYNALIGKLGKARRIDDCLFYFAEMRVLGIKPTSVTYGTIVNALCRVSDEKFAEELFDEMEGMANYKARPAPYNSMMQFFLTTKRDRSKVLEYFERMKSRGIAPTSHTFKLLIDTYATLEPVEMTAAQGVLDMMGSLGQRPEAVHYASLIHARGCVLHDLDGARELFNSIVDEALVPVNASLFQALFEAMVANHRVEDTEQLLAQMGERGVELTPYIANTLIHGWAARKNMDKAQGIYDAVALDRREPSTYEAMTRAFLSVDWRERAKGTVGEMLTRGYPGAVVNKVLELLGGGQEVPMA